MTVYYWMVVLIVIAAVLLRGNRKHSYKFVLVSFLILFAVMGLRDVYAFGSDASGSNGSYPIIFRTIGETEWGGLIGKGEYNANIGFVYLTKVLHLLTNGNYQFYITIISLFVTFSYLRFIGKYSPSPIQSILYFLGLLYYCLMFNALKQAVAMSILLFAFDKIIERKPIPFIILTLIAALFHFPALIFLPAYWIGHMKVGRKYISVLVVLLALTYLFRNQLLNLMLSAYGGDESEVTMTGIRFLRNKVIIMIAVAFFAVLIRPPSREDAVYNSLVMFLGIAIIFQTFCGYNNIFERLADYYFHTSIVLIPLIFEKGLKHREREEMIRNEQILDYITLALCGLSIWRFLSYVSSSGLFLPYRFFWER